MVKLPRLVILTGLLAACGADDRDPGEVRIDPGSGETQNSDSADMGASNMMEGDAGTNGMNGDDASMSDDAGGEQDLGGDDVPRGEVCPDVMSEPFQGMCDPVRGEGCPSPDEECRLGAQLVGTETVLTAFCQSATPSDQAIGVDEPCRDVEGVCAQGLWCASVLDVCRPICFPDNAVGCEPGQYCRHPGSDWIGIGYCYDACEL